nr:hypothetical protein 1634Bnrm2_p033 [Cryptomonas sp.]
MLFLKRIYMEEKTKDIYLKFSKNQNTIESIDCFYFINNNNDFKFEFFFWLVMYECLIFHIMRLFQRKKHIKNHFNYLNKKVKIYSKSIESFSFVTFIKNNNDNLLIRFFYILIKIIRIKKNYIFFLKHFFIHDSIKSPNFNFQYHSKNDPQNIQKYKPQKYKKLSLWNSLKSEKDILFINDIKNINIFLNEKITKINTLFSSKLIEQTEYIEQVYDNSVEACILFRDTNLKTRKTGKYLVENKKLKILVLICWVCLVLFATITK